MAKQLFAQVNNAEEDIVLERSSPHSPWILKEHPGAEWVRTGPAQFSVIINGRSHSVLVLKEDRENKTLRLRIGGGTYTVALEDDQSRLMKTLGLERTAVKVREIKAPMPGLVLNILVKPGDVVKKDEPLLVLEAMKMENVIKAPGDVVVSAVPAEQGKAVEKGQLLVSFA